MAEKKTTTKAASNEVAENVELKESEKTALEVEEASTQNKEGTGEKFKLADPNTSYQEKGFTLVGEQEKELPENPSTQLIARIRSGYIVKA
ncbi:hypothetical protein [Priestia megaterium]|uniref:hypothetical protein n=1 Tax=Priestia megaterium TaxID=1404 RepID=UPI002E1D82DC|nr:hypothetical protein [Priestia megaterium]MED4102205.1 hypothetical protein [Priestia megaterium]MED4142632.1 hypothetical protein [Priestia megaterium]